MDLPPRGCRTERGGAASADRRARHERIQWCDMKKRLRKKLRRGEFREVGFRVQFRLLDQADETAQRSFLDAFIGDPIERNGLVCGGQHGAVWDAFVTPRDRGTATEEHRGKVERWLQDHPEAWEVRVGPLVDAGSPSKSKLGKVAKEGS